MLQTNFLHLRPSLFFNGSCQTGRLRQLISNSEIQKPTHFTRLKYLGKSVLLLVMLLFGESSFSQTCDPEADFTYTVSGCEADFTPLYTGYTVHFWAFYDDNTGLGTEAGTTTVSNPYHTFNPVTGLTTRWVKHTVIVFENGQYVVKICEKQVPVNCSVGCEERIPYYRLDGCKLTLSYKTSIPFSVNWGDGTPITTGSSPLVHNYSVDAIYTITYTVNGQTCTFKIRVKCLDGCCEAGFQATAVRECGKLFIKLEANCKEGLHEWIFPKDCPKTVNLQPTLANQSVQITDVNIDASFTFPIIHRYTCMTGGVYEETQVVTFTDQLEGIYIGVPGIPTNLSYYNCVFPAFSHTGTPTKPVFVAGVINVDKPFIFNSTELQFDPGDTGFDTYTSSAPFTLQNQTLLHGIQGGDDCFYLWRGLKQYNTGILNITNSEIREAMNGILLNGNSGAITNISDSRFFENFVAIYATRSMGVFGMVRTIIDGGLKLRPAGTLQTTASSTVSVQGIPAGSIIFSFLNYVPGNHGFAGIYSQRAAVTFPFLVALDRNRFQNLNYGISVFDANVTIDRNSTFSDINKGAYSDNRTCAVVMYDRSGVGNDFTWTGTLDENNGTPDINNAFTGIIVRSQQGSAPVNVDISNMDIANVASGIFLDARFNNGTIIGNSLDMHPFNGVHNNRIISTINGITALSTNGGITYWDNSPTISDVEIFENNITVENFLTIGDWDTPSTIGISANGSFPISSTGTTTDEIDIHDNRVDLTQNGQSGIGFVGFPNGIIRNNGGGTGNGIFSSSNNIGAGLFSRGGDQNKIWCNDVVATGTPPTDRTLFLIESSSEVSFIRNSLEGPTEGIQAVNTSSNSELRCNTMLNNSIGLHYIGDVITGDQGTPSVSYGNIWNGTFTQTAQHDGLPFAVTLSQYYVRNVAGENPLGAIPGTWFSPVAPIVDCDLDKCPVEKPEMQMELTNLDEAVASREGVLPEATTWQLEFNLYHKLLENPSLIKSGGIMENFMNQLSGSLIDFFWKSQSDIISGFKPTESVINVLIANRTLIGQLLLDIHQIDSMILISPDIEEMQSMLALRGEKQDELNSLDIQSDSIELESLQQFRNNAINLLEEVNLVVPNFLCETNLHTVLTIYLKNIFANSEFSLTDAVQFKSVAEQCIAEGGIGVGAARMLYYSWVDRDLLIQEECNQNSEERERSREIDSLNVIPEIIPNPNRGIFRMRLPQSNEQGERFIKITNVFGQTIVESRADASVLFIDFNLALNNTPVGTYFISISHCNKVLTLPVVITN